MPLHKGKSNKVFSENVKELMDSGKPQKQALAVAYSMKRRSKKYSQGGKVENSHGIMQPSSSDLDHEKDLESSLDEALMDAHVHNEGPSENEDIVDAIMAKRRMAAGGEVDAGSEAADVFEPASEFDEHGQEGNLKENYASDLDEGPQAEDLVGQILKDRKSKRR